MSAAKKHRVFCRGREAHTDAASFDAFAQMVPVGELKWTVPGSSAVYNGVTIYIRTEEELDDLEREIEAQQGPLP